MLAYEHLQIIWYVILGTVFTGYLVLGGFDLGIGSLFFFLIKNSGDREKMYQIIGPGWDSNQVWLLTGAGVIFAAFAKVYATVFSGLYLLVMFFLLCIVLRTVAIEMRHQLASAVWTGIWDRIFAATSIVILFLIGLAGGNVLRGLPLDARTNYAGTLGGLFSPYALLFGAFALLALTLHGGTMVYLKAGESIQERIKRLHQKLYPLTVIVFAILVVWTFFSRPQAVQNYASLSIWWVFPVLAVPLVSLLAVVYRIAKQDWLPFFNSSLAILVVFWMLVGTIYPNIILNTADTQQSLTCFNASSSQSALTAMLIITLLALPVVLFYIAYVYRKFGGKVF